MTRRRILVLAATDWDRANLARPAVLASTDLVFDADDVADVLPFFRALTFDVDAYLDALAQRHARGSFDGVLGTGDYPGCMLAAAVAERLGLPGAGLGAVVRASHKFYSREVQRAAVPEATPEYEPIEPFDLAFVPRLGFPLFVKPVKGTMSIRAQLVRDRRALREALRFSLKEQLAKTLLLRPYQQLLARHTDGRVPAHFFVGERPLFGEQVTVDGFVQHGRVTVMGVVDSVMYPGTNSFERFEYPSRLPAGVQERMTDVVRRFVLGSGLDHSCFNVELFFDEESGAIHVIELNPRMSYQFGDLYERVDGTNSYDVQLALCTGQPARFEKGHGRDGAAASFVLRRFQDARVTRVPGPHDLARLEAAFPGTLVKVLCEEGRRLSAYDQDVGSYRYCIVNMGAPDAEALYARFDAAKALLPFGFAAT